MLQRPLAGYRKAAPWRGMLGALAALAAVCGSAQAQITIGNNVFPYAGAELHYAIDLHPGPAITVTPPGGFQHWDFSSLVASERWTETLRPASASADAVYFPTATLVATQTGPMATRPFLLPGSNGGEAFYRVTNNQVTLVGFGRGSDLTGLGQASLVDCVPDVGCNPDGLSADVTRLSATGSGLLQNWAPKQFFDIHSSDATARETYRPVALHGVAFELLGIRMTATVNSVTVVDGFGSLTLPGGGTFDVLREKTTTYSGRVLDLRIPLLGWAASATLVPELAVLNPELRIGGWEQTSYRYVDATSLETLAITRSPLTAWSVDTDHTVIASVQFKDMASPVPEAATAPMLLAGALVLTGWMAMRRRRATPGCRRR